MSFPWKTWCFDAFGNQNYAKPATVSLRYTIFTQLCNFLTKRAGKIRILVFSLLQFQ